MDAGDALRRLERLKRLESETEVEFDQALVLTSTYAVHTYAVPPDGDLVTLLTVQGSAIRRVCVKIMDATVYSSEDPATLVEIPVRINLMRLGYHRAIVQVTGADVRVTATFKLLSDDAERRRIATTEMLFALLPAPRAAPPSRTSTCGV